MTVSVDLEGIDKNKKKLLIEGFAKTMKSFFPNIGEWVKEIKDPRYTRKAYYHRSVMFWTGVFLFLFQLKSSRNINYKLNDEQNFLINFKSLFPLLDVVQYQDKPIERLPDYGALIDLMKKLSPTQLEKIQVNMVKRILQKRVLEDARLLDKYYLIAIDGSQILKFKQKHCEHCLRKEVSKDESGNPIYMYYHYVLAAKLVTHRAYGSFAIPIINEFVENESQDVERQDCEIRAFYRLAPRLKQYFPRTRFCLLLDSLYAKDPVFSMIKKFKWQYIIRLKKGSMPAFHAEYQEYLPFFPKNRAQYIMDSKTTQKFQWINDIEYAEDKDKKKDAGMGKAKGTGKAKGKGKGKSNSNNKNKGKRKRKRKVKFKHKLHVLECFEAYIKNKKGDKIKRHFLWISSIRVNQKNYEELSNKGGRCRWKIENQGFKSQKKEGYQLEHAYSEDYNAIKCFYHLLQIAHTINQLIEKGGMIRNIPGVYGSKKNYYDKFLRAFTEYVIDCHFVEQIINSSFQIRLDSS